MWIVSRWHTANINCSADLQSLMAEHHSCISESDGDDDLQVEQNPKLQKDVFNAAAILRISELRHYAERRTKVCGQI